MSESTYIALETGDTIAGNGFTPEPTRAELVFTTAYTGYEESLTDPSYNGQGLIFYYPLIGNYGVDERRFESDGIQTQAVIARELTDECRQWLQSEDVPYVEHVDTRDLVTRIREHGSLKAGIAGTERAAQKECARAVTEGIDMAHEPSDDLPKRYNGNGTTIAMLDCGVKTSMIDHFTERGALVVRLPWDVNADHISVYDPDLLFVSNGPGNPEDYQKAIRTIQRWHKTGLPIAGICLGQQLITLALGGSTQKMNFGHRGVNQPVYDMRDERVRMTTQNHSYEVDQVPSELELVQYNINDDSPEGLEGDGIICRQYHPEAHPGPHDSMDFFDAVLGLINP